MKRQLIFIVVLGSISQFIFSTITLSHATIHPNQEQDTLIIDCPLEVNKGKSYQLPTTIFPNYFNDFTFAGICTFPFAFKSIYQARLNLMADSAPFHLVDKILTRFKIAVSKTLNPKCSHKLSHIADEFFELIPSAPDVSFSCCALTPDSIFCFCSNGGAFFVASQKNKTYTLKKSFGKSEPFEKKRSSFKEGIIALFSPEALYGLECAFKQQPHFSTFEEFLYTKICSASNAREIMYTLSNEIKDFPHKKDASLYLIFFNNDLEYHMEGGKALSIFEAQ